jgi:hypothetical protein
MTGSARIENPKSGANTKVISVNLDEIMNPKTRRTPASRLTPSAFNEKSKSTAISSGTIKCKLGFLFLS